ncbi:phage portal protein [Phycicoccus sp. 3266]|uniref:phage portal protein n=1 Tax=Phycicoccus sp. 3266 TaxID=2817751 RepID=UPI002863DB97|nr:phage portal protein [Phycicoccus sp. 3266]MDR6861964.1 hypothetical protein [Phycicoccus sp. 3266]
MTIDVETPDSPGWWLRRCFVKLEQRRERIDPLFARYEGNAPLPKSMDGAPDAAKRFFQTCRTNFAEMVVKSIRYRLKVVSLQTSADSGETGDAEAWKAWKRAGMIVEHPDIVRNMLVAGDGYAFVAQYDDGPAATSEDPRQVVTMHDPVRQSVIRASAKFFHDADEGTDYAYLHRPGRVYVAKNVRSRRGTRTAKPTVRFSSAWEWDDTKGGADGQALPAGFEKDVMVVRYRNDEAIGDFERHLDLLDRIDHMVLQGMVVATLQAFKQRAIKVDPAEMPDKDPDTGEVIDYNDVFSADPAALWKLPQTADLWESGVVDVTPIASWVTKETERLSAVTFTPMSMFTPEGANQSAQGASLVREGMTFKVEDKQARIGAADAQVAAYILRLTEGLADRGNAEDITVGWAPAERFSISEKTTAAVAAKNAGVPWRTRMLDIMQFGPEKVEQMATERADDAILFPEVTAQGQAAAAAPPAPAQPGTASDGTPAA